MVRLGVFAAVVSVFALIEMRAQAPPVFRATISRVAIDVQVVDREGEPVAALEAADFRVTIGGRVRRVVSADLIRPGNTDPWTPASVTSTGRGEQPVPLSLPPARLYRRRIVVAVDSGSFDAAAWQRSVPALREFINSLDREDDVGLFVAPFGPVIAAGHDRSVVQRAIASIVVRAAAFDTQFNMTPVEVVDVMAESIGAIGFEGATVGRIQQRECPNDFGCAARILLDASGAVADLEARTMQSLNGLDQMFRAVATWPGRKTVILMSGGVLTSDRPGGRPDVVDMSRLLGRHLSASDAIVYTVLVDSSFRHSFSAADRIMSVPGIDQFRESRMQSQWLEQFSDSAGGALFRVQADQGESALAHIRREIGAFYLLGVEPGPEDRDGQPKELRVRVSRSGASVRSRRWVAVPPEARSR